MPASSKKTTGTDTHEGGDSATGFGGAKRAATRRTAAAPSPTTRAAQRIERSFRDLNDWRGELLTEIRRLIHEVDPGVIEEWKWMGTPVWSHDGMYALANPHRNKVKLTFFHGARLNDPKQLFNAGLGGNARRAIDFLEGDRINRVALMALLREAIAYNTSHRVPRSKGSRA